MQNHTLILSTAKVHIPESITIDFVTNLLNRGLTLIEYFGIGLDNQEDIIDEEMKVASAGITYINFHFDTPESIDYDSLPVVELEHLISEIIKKSANIDLRADEKDITVNL